MQSFKGLKEKCIELGINTPDGKPVVIKPRMADAEIFFLIRDDMKAEGIARVSTGIKNILIRSYPDDDQEDLDVYIAQNYTVLLSELSIVFGYSKRQEVEKVGKKPRKKQMSQ